MARNIGATLSLKDGNFFTNMKKAVTSADGLKTTLSGMQKGISSFSGSFKKAAGVVVGAVGAISTAAAGAAGYAVSIGSEYQTALSSIGAQTGAADAELDAFGETMKDIYAEGYGESFEDIAESISTVVKTAKDLDPSSIKEMTTNAMALRDTFGYDVQESVRAANMLMDQFGISGTQAFNLITQGAQQGLDKNGDLLDSINEYSVHFKQLGIDAEGMFNSLINGTESGTFSVDKLGDAVKEFGIRVKDGTGDDAFKTLGLSVDATKQAFAEGGAAAQQAFKDVNTALFSMDDKVQQNIIGVQLYGTMWEDLGAEGVKALTDISGQADMAKSSMEQLKDIKYDNLSSALEGIKRMLTTNILLPISQEIMPTVNSFAQGLSSVLADGKLSSIINTEISGIIDAVGRVFGGIKTVIKTNMPSIEAVGAAFSRMAESISGAFDGDIATSITDIANMAIPLLSSALITAANAVSFVINNWETLRAIALPVIIPIVSALGLYKGAVAACNAYDAVRNTLIKANSILLGTNASKLKGLTAKQLAHNIASKQGIAQIRLQTSLMIASGKAFVIQAANCVKNTAAMIANKTATIAVTAATKAAAAGQWLLNAAFSASPIGWIVLGIGAVVTAFTLLWNNCEGFRNFWINLWDTVKETAIKAWNGIKGAFEGIKNTIVGAFNTAKDAVSGAVETVRTTVSEKFNAVKETMGTVMETARSVVQEKLNNIKTAYEENGGGIQGIAAAAMEGVKGYFTAGYDFIDQLTGGKLTAIKEKFSNVFNSIKDIVSNVFNSIKTTISNVWDGIKSLIKTPHIVQKGTVSIAGIDTPIPKLGIEWYAKGGIMTEPTAFGINGGNAMVGGESGPEAVLPLDVLWRQLAQFADRLTGAAPTPAPAAVTNNIYVTVPAGTGRESDTELANKVAKRIIEVLDNM